MNILFLSIGNFSDLGVSSIYTDLLRYFHNNGHKVYLLCPRERRFGLPTEYTIEHGIHVLRVRTGNITKTNWLEKGITTLLIGRKLRKAFKHYYNDVTFQLILYSTPPITFVNTVNYIKNRDHAFTYLLLKDIFPQNALDIGILKTSGWKGLLTNYFHYKEKKLYQTSDCIGCMSNANANYLKYHNPYLDKKRIEVCPNTIDSIDHIQLLDSSRERLKEKFGLPMEGIIFSCIGNFGKPQNVDFIGSVLRLNKNCNDRHFVFCGSGTDFYKLKELGVNDINNITIMDSVRIEELRLLLKACDIGLIFLDHRFTIPNFPSRMLEYMKAGLGVAAATDSCTDLGDTILSGDFGWWCESKNAEDFQKIIDGICQNPEEMEEKKSNSFAYLSHHYDTKIAYDIIMNTYHLHTTTLSQNNYDRNETE